MTAAIVSVVVETAFFWGSDHVTAGKMLAVAVLALIIYLLGAIGPVLLVFRLSPNEALKSGETAGKARRFIRMTGLMGIAVNHMAGKMKRYVLSIIAMVFPTVLIAFFLFVTFRLKGVFYTSWLGQYAALQVGTAQYVAMIIALVIAVLTTAEIMWQNISERRSEIALYKAIGWQNGAIRRLVLFEGLFTGVVAGIISVIGSYAFIGMIYHQFPTSSIWLILATGLIPVVVGLIGSLIPAEIAVRISPFQGIRES